MSIVKPEGALECVLVGTCSALVGIVGVLISLLLFFGLDMRNAPAITAILSLILIAYGLRRFSEAMD